MPRFNMGVDFECYCSNCGAGICNNCEEDDSIMRLTIEPCENCIEEAREKGHEQGMIEAEEASEQAAQH